MTRFWGCGAGPPVTQLTRPSQQVPVPCIWGTWGTSPTPRPQIRPTTSPSYSFEDSCQRPAEPRSPGLSRHHRGQFPEPTKKRKLNLPRQPTPSVGAPTAREPRAWCSERAKGRGSTGTSLRRPSESAGPHSQVPPTPPQATPVAQTSRGVQTNPNPPAPHPAGQRQSKLSPHARPSPQDKAVVWFWGQGHPLDNKDLKLQGWQGRARTPKSPGT